MSPLRIVALGVALAALAAPPARAGEDGEAASPRLELPAPPPHAAFGLLHVPREPQAPAAQAGRRAGLALELPRGAVWTASAGSLPRPAERMRAPVMRGETSVVLPLSERIGIRTSLVDLYDGAAGDSTFQGLVGLALEF